jgi:hypothetical protein
MKSIRRSSGDEQPPAKRAKFSFDLEISKISKTAFWDAGDRSTHHLNYPSMTTSEYQRAKAHAKAFGIIIRTLEGCALAMNESILSYNAMF